MSNKTKQSVSIHADKANDESLRGVGKLDYTNAGRLHSTFKRIAATFAGDEHKPIPSKKKEKIKCPGCHQNFKTNNGKLPVHRERFTNTLCNQKKRWYEEPKIVNRAESVMINEFEVKKGDSVAFTTYPWNLYFVDPNELREYKVKELYNMDNGKVFLDLEGVENMISSNIFVKNFIKL